MENVFEIHNFFAPFRFLLNARLHFWNNTDAFTGMHCVGLYENHHEE